MEALKELIPFISIISVFGLYVIRSENKIHNLELKDKLMSELKETNDKISRIESETSTKIAEIFLKISHSENDISDIKNQVSEIYKIMVGK